MKIVSIVGARPQFIKAAVVSRAIREQNRNRGEAIQEVIVHTGQHYDENMSKIFFDELDIPRPSWNLGIHGGSHGSMTGRMIEGLERVLLELHPDWVLIYGDTNSTMAGAIAAKKLHMQLAHVEAGLRSFNMKMPEEQNRLVADRLSNLLLCPTENAVENLKKEGIGSSPYGERVVNTGYVMYDAALFYADLAARKSSIIEDLRLTPNGYVLSTVHREENTDDPARLLSIIDALRTVSREVDVVLPLHPRTQKSLENHNITTDGIKVIPPVSYLDMIQLEVHSKLIMTDSGGVQKEAYFLKKPCITLREETEWVELVKAGVNVLAGAEKEKILAVFHGIRWNEARFIDSFFGEGTAGQKITEALLNCRSR